MYLIFQRKKDALERAAEEYSRRVALTGIRADNTSFLNSIPSLTADETYALAVSNFELTPEEKEQTVKSFDPFPYEDLI